MIVMPLIKSLRKEDEARIWTFAWTHMFNTLKQWLVSTPILIQPDWKNEFYIYTYIDIY